MIPLSVIVWLFDGYVITCWLIDGWLSSLFGASHCNEMVGSESLVDWTLSNQFQIFCILDRHALLYLLLVSTAAWLICHEIQRFSLQFDHYWFGSETWFDFVWGWIKQMLPKWCGKYTFKCESPWTWTHIYIRNSKIQFQQHQHTVFSTRQSTGINCITVTCDCQLGNF